MHVSRLLLGSLEIKYNGKQEDLWTYSDGSSISMSRQCNSILMLPGDGRSSVIKRAKSGLGLAKDSGMDNCVRTKKVEGSAPQPPSLIPPSMFASDTLQHHLLSTDLLFLLLW